MDTLSSQSRQSRQRQILGKDLDTTQSASWEESEHFQIASRTQFKIVWWILISTKQKLHLKNGTPEGSSCATFKKWAPSTAPRAENVQHDPHKPWLWTRVTAPDVQRTERKVRNIHMHRLKSPPPSPPTTYSTSLNTTSPPQPFKQSKKVTDD